MRRRGARALFSVHDVMPETLDKVAAIVGELESAGCAPTTLLVVPGAGWTPGEIERLRGFVDAGHVLAAHGWLHRAEPIRGWKHRLHAALISRRAAEHMALDTLGIARLIERSCAWFPENSLPAPQLYVPPAWAMASIGSESLRHLPCRWFETLSGFFDSDAGCWQRMPLVGYEADTLLRSMALSGLNALNRRVARTSNLPLRVAIHPHDFQLRLGRALRGCLNARLSPLTTDDLA